LKARAAAEFFEENSRAESDNFLTKLQDLLVYVIPQLNKFPCDQKFMLGDRIPAGSYRERIRRSHRGLACQ
jgi:hypothetical protein